MAWGARRGIDDVLLRVRNNDPTLQALYLMGSRVFGEKEALALCDALNGNTALKELNISSHAVSPGMAAAIADMLAAPACCIESLSLGNRTFGDQGLAALCPGIKGNISLQLLNLEAKGITAATCAGLAGALAENGSIQELVLAQNDLKLEGIAALAPGLLRLKVLDIRSTGLEEGLAWEAVGRVLQDGGLQVLRCEGNQLGEAGAATLAPALAVSSSLRHLHMAHCGLGPAGARLLAACLPHGLASLDWSDDGIGPEGAAALGATLGEGRAPGLCTVVLCNNGIDGEGAIALARGLAQLATGGSAGGGGDSAGSSGEGEDSRGGGGLSLDLGGNAVGQGALAGLAPCHLAALRLHDCQLGDGGAAELARLIREGGFSRLRELDVSANGMGTEGLLALLGGCAGACASLQLLVLAANEGLEGEGVAEAVEGLQEARPGLTVVRRAADSGELGKGGS